MRSDFSKERKEARALLARASGLRSNNGAVPPEFRIKFRLSRFVAPSAPGANPGVFTKGDSPYGVKDIGKRTERKLIRHSKSTSHTFNMRRLVILCSFFLLKLILGLFRENKRCPNQASKKCSKYHGTHNANSIRQSISCPKTNKLQQSDYNSEYRQNHASHFFIRTHSRNKRARSNC